MRLFNEQDHYTATIESQEFTSGYGGKPQLVLRVKLQGKANKPNDMQLAAGETVLPESLQMIRTLYFDLDPGNAKLSKVLQELNTLGFTDTLLPRLHPAHRKHFSFLGQKCLVRCWYKEGTDKEGRPKEQEKWFLVTPRSVETFDLAKFEEIFTESADTYVNAANEVAG